MDVHGSFAKRKAIFARSGSSLAFLPLIRVLLCHPWLKEIKHLQFEKFSQLQLLVWTKYYCLVKIKCWGLTICPVGAL